MKDILSLLGKKIKVMENESSLLRHIIATLTLPRNHVYLSKEVTALVKNWKWSYDKIQEGKS